jgi:hypothetical protein
MNDSARYTANFPEDRSIWYSSVVPDRLQPMEKMGALLLAVFTNAGRKLLVSFERRLAKVAAASADHVSPKSALAICSYALCGSGNSNRLLFSSWITDKPQSHCARSTLIVNYEVMKSGGRKAAPGQINHSLSMNTPGILKQHSKKWGQLAFKSQKSKMNDLHTSWTPAIPRSKTATFFNLSDAGPREWSALRSTK